MEKKRVRLFDRLPEIYRTKDAEQLPPDQLKSYLALVEDAFGAIHENIESLYHDLFIETCDEWVIPYIGDLLGTSHLSGEPWTLRADVADTIALRRRKGTLGAIELLTYNLTRWGVHSVELRENLVWSQHLNHQRPDEGGRPPYRLRREPDESDQSLRTLPGANRRTVIRGGTVTLRDPATLALLGTPFDPFAHMPDVKSPAVGRIRYNLPNLAIFLWRLAAYRLAVIKPLFVPPSTGGSRPNEAPFIVRVNVNPVRLAPVRLFNTNRFDLSNRQRDGVDKLNLTKTAPRVSLVDEAPGPIPVERLSDGLTKGTTAGAPEAYVFIEDYDPAHTETIDLADVGLQLHLPQPLFAGQLWPQQPTSAWKIRGANLCAWQAGLEPPLADHEIAIDPVIGRIAIGVANAAQATALENHLLVTYTYGAPGPVGAHPIDHPALPPEWTAPAATERTASFTVSPNDLRDKLAGIHSSAKPLVIEIKDSRTHILDLLDAALAAETVAEGGVQSLLLGDSLIIRAADGERPILELKQPLRFRPAKVKGVDAAEQKILDAKMERLTVRLEGLYVTRGSGFPVNQPLIARAALNRLELINCTLDPGGYRQLDGTPEGTRAPILESLRLSEPYGFSVPADETAFNQTPEVVLSRTISGPLFLDAGYELCLTDSIIDAGQGVGNTTSALAISNATDQTNGYGPPTRVSGVTFFGRVRVQSIDGGGGIFVHALEALNNQIGCLKFSYFSGESADRLPQNQGCVKGIAAAPEEPARLRFVSEIFGEPAYGQLAMSADRRIREQGPGDDAMGAYGFLQEAHKWRNLQIRFREFMPVGIRPLLIPVT